MSNSNKSLEILDTGKTVIFTSPLSGYDNYLVRTGVIQENDSFLHSLLTGYSKDYFYMDVKSKKKFLEKFKENIFTIKEYEKDVNNYTQYKLSVVETLKNIYIPQEDIDKKIKKIVKYVCKNPIYEILSEILPYDDITKMFKVSDDLIKGDNIFLAYKDLVKHEIKNYLDSLEVLNHVKDENKVIFIKKNVKNIVSIILEETEFYLFNKYYRDITKDVSITMINTLIKNLKLDLYFIDYKTKLPFKYNEDQLYKNKKSIILLKLENTYETIGLLLEGNKVQRNFENNNFLIKKIKTFLFETDKIPSKYPELLQYIAPPKIFKNKKHILDESDNESDNENTVTNATKIKYDDEDDEEKNKVETEDDKTEDDHSEDDHIEDDHSEDDHIEDDHSEDDHSEDDNSGNIK